MPQTRHLPWAVWTSLPARGIKLPTKATLVLADGASNTISSTYDDASSVTAGIYFAGEGTSRISGSGTLNATGGTIGGTGTAISAGIYGETNCTINVSGSPTITANGGSATGNYSGGIYWKGAIAVSETPTINATGGDGKESYGIYAPYAVSSFSGGTIDAIGGDNVNNSVGLCVGSFSATKLNIGGGTLTATAATGSTSSYGVTSSHAGSAINITGGTTTVSGNTGAYGFKPTLTAALAKTSGTTTPGTGSYNTNSWSGYQWVQTSPYGFSVQIFPVIDTPSYQAPGAQVTYNIFLKNYSNSSVDVQTFDFGVGFDSNLSFVSLTKAAGYESLGMESVAGEDRFYVRKTDSNSAITIAAGKSVILGTAVFTMPTVDNSLWTNTQGAYWVERFPLENGSVGDGSLIAIAAQEEGPYHGNRQTVHSQSARHLCQH